MKSEIYVIHLLKASAVARKFIEQECGKSAKDLLENLSSKEALNELARCLGVVSERVFETLAELLRHDIQGKEAPRFLDEQLVIVINIPSNLLSILECNSAQALEQLFDVPIIWNIIFEKEPVTARQKLNTSIQNDYLIPPAENVLLKFLALYKKSHNQIEIGKIIDEYHCLHRSALTKLRNYALEKGYTIGSDSSLLRVAIDSSCSEKKIHEKNLDTLAIIYIEQTIKWIVIQMREEAQTLASNINNSVPENSPLEELQSHIEFYELKAPAIAWRKVFSRMKTNPDHPDELQENTLKSDQFHQFFLEALEQIPEFLPCLILTGISIPRTRLNSIWDEQLSNQLPFSSIKSDQDTIYPMNQKNIIEQIQKDYKKQSRLYKLFD